jgi:adenylyl-sulfate kinase
MERGFTLWFTGLSGAGKTTLAQKVEQALRQQGRRVELLDGDEVRTHLSKGLGFSREDRDTNILRIGFVCRLLSRNGVIAIGSAISPYRETRDQVRSTIDDFVEVFVDTPLDECRRRDVKGLYHKALVGEVAAFTGVSDPYEPPFAAEITVQTLDKSPEQCAADILSWLQRRGYLEPVSAAPVSAKAGASNGYSSPNGHGGAEVQEQHGAQQPKAADEAYSPEEEANVSARLEALGYL